jgi:hypothetical protein
MRISCATVAACALFAGCATAPKSDPPSDDGLVLVPNSMLDELYVAPGVSLANYHRVMLEPIEITFRDGWRKEHPELSDREYEAFCKRLTDMFHEKLVAELARGGYTIAESPEKDVLRVRPSLEKVDFAAPESASDKKTLTHIDGQLTLRVQGFDGPSGALVARAKDYEEDFEKERLKRADRTTAMLHAERIFEKWAEELRSALDVAKVSAGARHPQEN